jgi:hypothetical protein
MLWTGGLFKSGYARFYLAGHPLRAHRVAYFLAYGAIPDNLVVDHVKTQGCRHLHCVAPEHLEAVTQAENVLRGANGHRDRCPQGHPYSGSNLYVRPGTNRWRCQTCHRAQEAERRKRARLTPSAPCSPTTA